MSKEEKFGKFGKFNKPGEFEGEVKEAKAENRWRSKRRNCSWRKAYSVLVNLE